MGAALSALTVFWFGSQFQAVGYLLGWAWATDPWSTMQGEISYRAPPLMAQLYFYCKISITPAVQGPACLLPWLPLPTSATVNSLLVFEFWYTEPSIEKRKTADHRWSLQSNISSDSWTLLQQGHRRPGQGTCLKSQRCLLEDGWTSSCMLGTLVQPLSQGEGGSREPKLACCDLVSLSVQQCNGGHRRSSLLSFWACRSRHLEEHKALLILLQKTSGITIRVLIKFLYKPPYIPCRFNWLSYTYSFTSVVQDSFCHCLWLRYILLVVAAAWAGWGDPPPYDPHPLEMLCDL